MMPIHFQFDTEKSIQAIAYLLHALGGTEDKRKLMKLLYRAERDHFLQFGRPITGDSLCALPLGPVPSGAMDLINGNYEPQVPTYVHFQVNNNTVELADNPGDARLDESDKAILDQVVQDHGNKHPDEVQREAHGLPEYRETYPHDSWTSKPIPYELILSLYHGGDQSKFRHGRPVISPAMASEMACPFPSSDANL